MTLPLRNRSLDRSLNLQTHASYYRVAIIASRIIKFPIQFFHARVHLPQVCKAPVPIMWEDARLRAHPDILFRYIFRADICAMQISWFNSRVRGTFRRHLARTNAEDFARVRVA